MENKHKCDNYDELSKITITVFGLFVEYFYFLLWLSHTNLHFDV